MWLFTLLLCLICHAETVVELPEDDKEAVSWTDCVWVVVNDNVIKCPCCRPRRKRSTSGISLGGGRRPTVVLVTRHLAHPLPLTTVSLLHACTSHPPLIRSHRRTPWTSFSSLLLFRLYYRLVAACLYLTPTAHSLSQTHPEYFFFVFTTVSLLHACTSYPPLIRSHRRTPWTSFSSSPYLLSPARDATPFTSPKLTTCSVWVQVGGFKGRSAAEDLEEDPRLEAPGKHVHTSRVPDQSRGAESVRSAGTDGDEELEADRDDEGTSEDHVELDAKGRAKREWAARNSNIRGGGEDSDEDEEVRRKLGDQVSNTSLHC
jgi:hypothetical protein